jgi:hypothetical protein
MAMSNLKFGVLCCVGAFAVFSVVIGAHAPQQDTPNDDATTQATRAVQVAEAAAPQGVMSCAERERIEDSVPEVAAGKRMYLRAQEALANGSFTSEEQGTLREAMRRFDASAQHFRSEHPCR